MTDGTASSLGRRGAELASGPNQRDLAGQILGKDWHPETNPDGLVNIGTAENYSMFEDVADFVKSLDLQMNGQDINYGEGPWGSGRLRKAMAKYINKYFHPYTPIEADDLFFATGCTSIFHMLGYILGDPGDGVLLSMPSYVAFPNDFGLYAKLKPIFVPFHGADQFEPDAVKHYDEARRKAEKTGTRVKAMMLCHPHNPTGQCYSKEAIIELMKFCNANKIHMFADEVYAQSVYEVPGDSATPFVSTLSFDHSEFIHSDYFHFQYGMSKDLACGGLRMGVLWSKNKELMRAMGAIGQFHWPGAMDERVATTMLENEAWIEDFLGRSRERLAASNALSRRLMDEAGIRYSKGSNAGFFFWIDLSPWLRKEDGEDDWEREEKLARKMLANKVFLVDGKAQASERPGYFRLVFSRDERTMREGFGRLLKALKY